MKSLTASLTASALATVLLLSLAPRSSAASIDSAFTPACGAVPAGQARCFVLIPQPGPATGDRGGLGASPFPHSYGPSDLQSAYALTTLAATNGATQTIALVDANDDPAAESDLATYRAFYHLPPCTTANGCFRKVNQAGGTTYPAPNFGWAAETSTDLDMASAVCPPLPCWWKPSPGRSPTWGRASTRRCALGRPK